MADQRARRIAELIKPLRVRPGSKVNLARDFDPGYKAGFLKKKDGADLLATGIEMLADYQARLAAQDTYGVLVCLQAGCWGQGRDDPPRDERGEPAGRAGEQLQSAVLGGTGSRLPVAVRPPSARAGRYRDLQPVPLRGGPGGAGAPGEP